ncbi:phosphatidate cytidylyltransferase [Brevundimonas aveniformis]|mgnify:CR=1 FL=1|uniref:phosphatidate cytidylyltransferase n=1 Tax=Brevundimonas aveniformis TaxID=370977 RepID=UPI000419E2AA|nr:phosphatidate cytidylyltransferase [Brevundimonas aveniformis]
MTGRDIAIRAGSAAVLAPLAIAGLWLGGWAFGILMTIAVVLLSWEWAKMTAPGEAKWMAAAVAAGIVIPGIAVYLADISLGLVLLAFGALIAFAIAQLVKRPPIDAAYGVFYIGWPLVLMVWLRISADGGSWIILLFAVTWAADVFAYLVGSLLKGPKLWPRFSPNKTWSGFLGGLVGGTAMAVVLVLTGGGGWLHFPGVSLWLAAFIGLSGALATMAGDLWESALKRRYGVKDSGDLIPGHGGLLDRVDGLMFAVVVVAAIKLAVDQGVAV